ncbi:hypothetical protein [Pectinatus frisingensis]|uniref:hypothetical protein n=1 Tax=Pectinatus frisingensis TaxID=865 RepID=UPI003D8017F1
MACADLTYVKVGGKWYYLAAVLDLARRKLVGWALENRPTAKLAAIWLFCWRGHQKALCIIWIMGVSKPLKNTKTYQGKTVLLTV